MCIRTFIHTWDVNMHGCRCVCLWRKRFIDKVSRRIDI